MGRLALFFLLFLLLMTVAFYVVENPRSAGEDAGPNPQDVAQQLDEVSTQLDEIQDKLSTITRENEREEKKEARVFWQIAVYFFTGFADYEPQTPAGKLIAVLVFIVGIGLVATATGRMASYFVTKNLTSTMPDDLSKHIILCNWNERGDRIITELHSEQCCPDTEIVVIAQNQPNKEEYSSKPAYKLVTFIQSDPALHDVLRICGVQRARAVIVIADEVNHPEDPDGNSALIALAANRLCDDAGLTRPNRPHIVAESLNHRRIQHLKDAGVDEVICAHDFGLGILAQCSIHHHLSEVYNRLLTYSDNTNEIYLVDEVPEGFHGLTFDEALAVFAQNRKGHNPAILIGVKRGGEIFLNSREDDHGNPLGTIQPGDQLITIAFDLPDLSEFSF